MTLLLAATLLPGLSEIAETIEHMLHDGHMPHSAQHEQEQITEDHHDGLDDEHGCTPMAHHCGCHASMLGILADGSLAIRRPPHTADGRPFGSESTPLSRANAPPTPPPIA